MVRKKTEFIDGSALISRLPVARRAKVEARAKELIAEEMTLADLRKALSLTQMELSAALGIGQERVSRLEHRSDMLLSTLAGYVKAMGGDLKLVVSFPDRKPVALTQLADFAVPKARSTAKTRRSRNRKAA